jgi:hypothetical protein
MDSLFKTLVTVAVTQTLMLGASWIGPSLQAQEAVTTIQISVKSHHFQPAEVHVAANKPIILRIKNLDATPMEFESVTLRVEKIVAGNSEGIVRLRALAPGRYEFFDDFHQESRGSLVAQ